MNKKMMIIVIGIFLVSIIGFVAYGHINDFENSRQVTIWYWDDGQYDPIRSYILLDLVNLSNQEDFTIVKHKFNRDMLTYEEYLKRLSVALSTGECDMTFTRASDLKAMSSSLLSLKDIEGYDRILESFRFDKFIFLVQHQTAYGINKNILDAYDIPYDSDLSYEEYFQAKKAFRDEGNVIVLDSIELRELVDEFFIGTKDFKDPSRINYIRLYQKYIAMNKLIHSGVYDYSEIELKSDFIYKARRNNPEYPFFTESSGYESNIFTNKYRFIKNDNFALVNDIRFYQQANKNWDSVAVGISAFSGSKETCKKLIKKLVTDDIQKWIYKQLGTCATGYETIAPVVFNDLLPSFTIERDAYLAAAEGDPKFAFSKVTLEELKLRDMMYRVVLDSIQDHKLLEKHEFINRCSEEVFKIRVDAGMR